MVRECVIGIDMGTTSVKAIAFANDGAELARSGETLPLLHDSEGAAEQDPDTVYAAVVRVTQRLLADVRALGYAASRIGLSSAMHSIFAVDASGKPICHAMTWMDTRAAACAVSLWSDPVGRTIYQRTGTPIHPMTPSCKLAWLRDHRPNVFQKAFRFVSLKEYIWYRWFGEWEIDCSMASATGMYNLKTGQWDDLALDWIGIQPAKLSTLVPTTHIRQGVREPRLCDAGLAADLPVCIGASDGVLANLGAGAIDGRTMVMTVGTSCAVRVGSSRIVTNEATRTFCYVLGEDRFIVGGPSNSGGIVLDWLCNRLLAGNGSFETLLDQAAAVDSDGLYCLPYLTGERAPLWNANASAGFFGLRMHHTPAHLLRAAVEGIIYNAYWIATGLTDQTQRAERLIASGKAMEPRWIRQIAADTFGLPVQLQSDADASVLGAVRLANIACGIADWEADSQTVGELILPRAEESHKRHLRASQFRQLAETAFKVNI